MKEKSFTIEVFLKLECNNCGKINNTGNHSNDSINIQGHWPNDELTGKPVISFICDHCGEIGFINFSDTFNLFLPNHKKSFVYLTEDEKIKLEKNILETKIAHSKH